VILWSCSGWAGRWGVGNGGMSHDSKFPGVDLELLKGCQKDGKECHEEGAGANDN